MMALLELGDQVFHANEVILCIRKPVSSQDASDLLRSIKTLLYIGFSLISPAVYGQDSSFIFLGYEI